MWNMFHFPATLNTGHMSVVTYPAMGYFDPFPKLTQYLLYFQWYDRKEQQLGSILCMALVSTMTSSLEFTIDAPPSCQCISSSVRFFLSLRVLLGQVLIDLVILPPFYHQFTTSESPLTVPENSLQVEKNKELPDSSSVNQFWGGRYAQTDTQSPFFVPVEVSMVGSGVDTQFFQRPVWMLGIVLSAPSNSFVMEYPASSIGRHFPGYGCLFPQMKHFFSYVSILIRSLKSFQDRQKQGSLLPLSGGVVFCYFLQKTDLAAVPIGYGGLWERAVSG